jgi:hypothetical protein
MALKNLGILLSYQNYILLPTVFRHRLISAFTSGLKTQVTDYQEELVFELFRK